MPVSPDLRGKVCLITGANCGIGKATALGLAKMGATVVLGCREAASGRAALAEVVEKSGNKSIGLLIADLASQAALRQMVEDFKSRYACLHILINNAGLSLGRRSVTVDGLETTLAVNYLAPFLLTHLLLERLKAGAPARVINLATWVQPAVDLDDLMRVRRYDAVDVYNQSKTALVMFTHKLAPKLQGTGVTINCVNPGLVRTNLGRDSHGLFRLFLALMRPFMLSPERAAQTLIYLAAAPELEGITGKFFTGQKETRASPESYEDAPAQRLWQMSEQLTHLPQATV